MERLTANDRIVSIDVILEFPMIVVTAPTGNIGRQILTHLVDSGEHVRVVARDPSGLPPGVADAVEVIGGSHGDGDVVRRAFANARAVFWLPPGDTTAPSATAAYVDFTQAACDAIEASGVRQVVGISALGRGWGEPAGHVTASLAMDDMIAATGVAYRALACASLMENVLRQASLIRDVGSFYWPTPAHLPTRHVATRDVAAVAADLLRDPSWDGVDSIPLLGPEDLNFEEMMAIASDVLETPVRYHEMSMQDLREMMIGNGASPGMADAMVEMMTAKNAGMDHMVERTPEAAALTPTTFRQWCETSLKSAIEG